MDKLIPESWNIASKPHLFCPGCGHAITLKHLGYLIDYLKIDKKLVFGIDIGCSLLAWNFFNSDTIQTHHGRTTPVMVGLKMADKSRIAIAYMGDGGAYAIGLQSLLHAAFRNDPITVIVINNENYAMTGGQMSPTTPDGEITTTSPKGKEGKFGPAFHGPELVAQVANEKAYVARATVSKPVELQRILLEAIRNQTEKNSFAFVEVLSICPTNWKTNAKSSFDHLKMMEAEFPRGVIKKAEVR